VLAQRLVRRNCAECGAAYTPDPADLPSDFSIGPGRTLTRGGGCRACRNTGFRGRVGIYELLHMAPALREMVMERKAAPAIAQRALADDELVTLRQDGFAKVLDGVTTVAEVSRALTV
ncbi:MAG: hypothetical protein AAF235_07845, partial [Planctomycetota bacterium]